ncbi:MAG TPA: serine/threonine-protein kinase [Chloroflexi bacterium]|nr:serine/threonine-protein kinase [Chloroflexota bacterium]
MSPANESRERTSLPSERSLDLTGGEASDDLSTRLIHGEESTLPGRGQTDGRLAQGSLLQGRYRILSVLGSGGMSTVYKAQDLRFPRVARLCAIKEMSNTILDPRLRQQALTNFEREASLLATLSHPAIPQVYDYFTEGDHSYLVMEFISGKDLEALLEEMEGFPPEEEVIRWALEICDVLKYLHNHKPHPIIFRDLKPSNIMLDDQGRIRLVDFGIAKVFQTGKRGTMVGTEGYAPPEQYRGIASPQGDIYALGATLHHLLTKQDPRLEPPFSFRERPIQAVNPLVSDELVAIIDRALEYDPQRRFASVEEMQRALLRLSATKGISPGVSRPRAAPARGPKPLWTFACEDEIRSSPTVVDGILYVGAYDNNLYALDAGKGTFIWKYPTEGGVGSSPCVSEGRVFVGSKDHSLYVVDARTGRLVWTFPTKGPIFSSPRVQFGYVFFGSDDRHLYVVHARNGRKGWTFEAEAPIRSTPALGKDAVYFGDEGGSLYAVNVEGRLRWRFRSRRGITSSPCVAGDLLFVGSKDWYVYALELGTGWAVWRYRTEGPVVSSPAVAEGTVFIGSADGKVYALNGENGQVIWRYQTEGQVTSSPTFYEGAVYIGSTDGSIYAIDAQTGRLRWRFKTEGPVVSTPCVVNGVVYVGSCDRRIYALPA